jgi:hypothetical protein
VEDEKSMEDVQASPEGSIQDEVSQSPSGSPQMTSSTSETETDDHAATELEGTIGVAFVRSGERRLSDSVLEETNHKFFREQPRSLLTGYAANRVVESVPTSFEYRMPGSEAEEQADNADQDNDNAGPNNGDADPDNGDETSSKTESLGEVPE